MAFLFGPDLAFSKRHMPADSKSESIKLGRDDFLNVTRVAGNDRNIT